MSFNLSAKEFDYLQKTVFGEPKRAARAAQQEDELNSTDLYLQQHRKPEEQGLIADFTDSVQMGAWQGLSDLSRGLGVVFNSDWLNQAADWAAHNAEANRQTMSSKMQQALGQSAFDGWDSEKGEGKGVLNAYWWAGNFGALLGQQLDTVATLGAGKIATTGLKIAGKQAGKMLGREAAEQIGKAATQQAARFGIPQKYHQSIGVTAVMSAMQAGSRANQVFEEIDQLSDEQLAQLDGFRQDYWDLKESEEGQGLDDRTLFDQAKARFQQRAGKDAALDPVALATDLTTNAISGLGGGFWGAMKPAQTLKDSFFKGGAIEALTEGMQGAAETYAVNDTARNFYDRDRTLTEGMGRNVVDGMVLGGVMGAGMGAMDTHSHRRTMNRERKRYVEAIQTGDEVVDQHLRSYVEMVNNAANDIDELISQSRFNAMHAMAQKEARAKQVMAEVQAQAEQAVGSEGDFTTEPEPIMPTIIQPTTAQTGASTQIQLGSQGQQQVDYELVEASELTVNLKPNVYQNRDRTSADSQMQINDYARNLNPAYLGVSVDVTQGAPTVDENYGVFAGNGRLAAIQQAYQHHPQQAVGYKQFLANHAEQFGFSPEQVNAMQQPVLVRKVKGNIDVAKAVEEGNFNTGLDKGVLGDATANAKYLTPDLLREVQINDDGTLNLSDSNTPFIQGLIGKIPVEQRPKFFAEQRLGNQSAYTLTAQGKEMVENALLVKAFSDPNNPTYSQNLLTDLIVSTDESSKRVKNALISVAGKVIQTKNNPDFDISGDIAQAYALMRQGKQEGKNIDDLLAQQDFVNPPSNRVQALTRLFYSPKSVREVQEPLNAYFDSVINSNLDQTLQESMFGDEFAIDRDELMRNAGVKFSRSAMKSVEANIARGREAMTRAILDKDTVHRAMYRNDLDGWIDFEWGDTGRLLPSGKTKGAMGIAHIIEARMRKDNMSYEQATRMLTERVVDTIAKGRTSNIYENGNVQSVFIEHDGNRATLVRRKGTNAWLMNAFELKPVGEQVGSNDPSLPTHTLPTRQRQDMGATGSDNLLQTDEQGNSFKLSRSAQEPPSFYETEQRLGGKEAYESAVRNGETELDYRQWVQVRTPEFKAWFGDWENDPENASKVVNPRTGEPLVVYHGGRFDINSPNAIFDTNKQGSNYWMSEGGFFFTDRESSAENYAREVDGKVTSTFISSKRPISGKFSDYYSAADHFDMNSDEYMYEFIANNRRKNSPFYSPRELKNDGIYFTSPEGNFIVATSSNQIKSATDNTGAFDVGNDDIRFSKALQKPDRLEKLRQAKPIEISGNEIQPSDDLRQYKRNALEYGKSLRGAYTNKDTGEQVVISREGINEVIRHDYKDADHLQSVAAIPKIIEEGIYIDTVPNEDLAKNPHIKEYEYYLTGLKIGATDYTVRAVVGVGENGNRYYDHKLTKIEKGELLSYVGRVSTAEPGKANSPLSNINDKRLLQILQQQNANLEQTHAQIKQIVGGKLAEHFNVVSREQLGITDPTIEAGYDPKTGKIFIVEENIRDNGILSRDERLKWVAWHELAHRGVQVRFAKQYQDLMAKIDQNSTIRDLANAIQQQREETKNNRTLAIEEALAELNAAYSTGKMDELKARYGIKVPPLREKSLRAWFEMTAERIREFVARLFGQETAEKFSQEDLIKLIKDIQSGMGGEIGRFDGEIKQSADEKTKIRSFNATAEQYGGKPAYEQARAEGKTELDYHQWVQVRTPEFKAWFGDWENDPDNASKVINPKTGEPLVVYHGSKSGQDFNIFDPKMIGKRWGNGVHGKGFYFASNLGTAMYYGERPLKEAFLNVRNPFNRNDDKAEVNSRFTSTIKRKGNDGVIGKDTLPWSNETNLEFVAFNPNQIKSATDNTGAFDIGNDDIRYSLNEDPHSDFAKAVDAVASGRATQQQIIDVGTTPDVLKMLGLPDVNVVISGAVLRKVMLDKHNVTAETLKQLPREINNPVAVMKSSTQPNGYVVLTELTENVDGKDKPVVSALHLKQSSQGLELINIASVYGRNHSQIQRGLENDLLYWHKEKGAKFLDNLTLQLRSPLSESSSIRNNIKTETDLSQYQHSQIKFSRTQTNTEQLRRINRNTPLENLSDAVSDIVNTPVSEWKQRLSDYGKVLNANIFDALAPLKYAEDKAGIRDHSQSAYTAARLAAGSASITQASLAHGLPEYRDGIIQRKQGTSSKDALVGIMEELGSDSNDFFAWMAGNRAERLMQEGREKWLSASEIAELKALNKGKEAKFEQARIKFMAWNKSLLDLAESAGLINAQDRANWESHDFYIPFYREDDNGDAIAPYRNKGLSGQNAGIRRLRGSDRAVNDLLENVVHNASKLIDASVKNIAMTKAVTNLTATNVIEVIQNPTPADWRKVGANRTKADKDGGYLAVRLNGVETVVKVNDKLLFNAITNIDQPPLDYAGRKLFSGAKRVLTATVTSMPNFIVRNFFRDAAQAWTTDRNNGFKLGIDSLQGLKKAYQQSDTAIDLMFAGASFNNGFVDGGDTAKTANKIRKHLRKQGKSADEIEGFMKGVIFSKDKLDAVLDGYFKVAQASENANRIAVYERAIASGKSKAQAALESKDLMDFAMHGNAKAVRFLSDVLPFFNARLQGLSQLGRSMRDNPKGVASRGAMIALASVALAAMNEGEDWYEEQGDEIKDNFWLAKIGDEIIKIPKPFEVGVMFGTIPERLYRTMSDSDDTGLFKDRLLSALTNTLSLNPIPQAVKPIFEVYNNYDSFRGREIENMSDRRLIKQERYDNNTSLVARELGNVSAMFGLSPKQVDHLVNGYFGTLGMYVLGITDMGIRSSGNYGELPAKNWQEYPVLNAVFGGSIDVPRKYTKQMSDFYRYLNQASEIAATVKSYQDDGLIEKSRSLFAENHRLLAYRPQLNAVQKEVKQIRAQMELIQNNRNLDAEQKRERIDRLLTRRNALVTRIVEQMKDEDF